jgi:dTDP-4-amino-4,6-dideoxygalactose transaminase
MRVLFNQPTRVGREMDYLAAALEQKRLAGGGSFTVRSQQLLEQQLGAGKALLTTSCTAALEMAAILLDAKPGDEVIIPSFCFVSVANAFVLRGATPVFADMRPDTLNIDETKLERHLTKRTKAIVVMHYAGIGCEMDAILDLARRFSVAVVEDNAHGLFSTYKGKQLGTFGCLATQSFHETKNFTCGEGGALLINDAGYNARAEIIWEKGTNRFLFLRGQVEKYTWVDVGSSYLPADLLAAFLLAQLEAREEVTARRQAVWEFYDRNLQDWAHKHGARLPTVPGHVQQPYHLYYVILPSSGHRHRLIKYLAEREIDSAFHYIPLHLSKMGLSLGGRQGDCPIAEDLSERLLRLPFHTGLTEAEQMRVIAALNDFN